MGAGETADVLVWGLSHQASLLCPSGLRQTSRIMQQQHPAHSKPKVLMRALRDFNLPKIVTNDVSIFLGLINDLFPLLEVPRKKDLKMEQMVRQSIAELRLQPEETFILKVAIMTFPLSLLCT
ncbi:hypothetical protein NDU88_004920 [Pleurodeles waltl]|uniref:Dynein heavy chain hydrolytic ATP-binding dynein motor region domain-containing protein n=1 Tax=Pleurodeles waltl TaxID=8319 RepID=A0AAV7UID7_PLEWA|nr:hypothetical protein NDU88_004920 [Pleurodeles waltl]